MLIPDYTCMHSCYLCTHSRKNVMSRLNCFQSLSADDTFYPVIVNINWVLKKENYNFSLSSRVAKAHIILIKK